MGAWDNAPEPQGPAVNFVSLKNTGDEFVGRVESVELITIPAGTLPQQPQDLVDVPRVMYTGVDGQTYEFKYTTAVFRNGILRLRPEPGTWVYHKRLAKNPKGYVDGVIRVARTEETIPGGVALAPRASEPATPSTDAGLRAPAGPVADNAPPF